MDKDCVIRPMTDCQDCWTALARLFVAGPLTMIPLLLCSHMHTKTHSLPQIIIHSNTHAHITPPHTHNFEGPFIRAEGIKYLTQTSSEPASAHLRQNLVIRPLYSPIHWISLQHIQLLQLQKGQKSRDLGKLCILWTLTPHRAGPDPHHNHVYDSLDREAYVPDNVSCNWAAF